MVPELSLILLEQMFLYFAAEVCMVDWEMIFTREGVTGVPLSDPPKAVHPFKIRNCQSKRTLF